MRKGCGYSMIYDQNERVYDLYKTLDSALKRLVGLSGTKSGIYLYIKILPAKRAAILDTIRNWRNLAPGHGVGPKPIAPVEWIAFLENEIRYVEGNKSKLRDKLIEAEEELERAPRRSSEKAKRGRSTSGSGSRAENFESMMEYYRRGHSAVSEKATTDGEKSAYRFVDDEKEGFFSRVFNKSDNGGYGWVLVNHNGEFLYNEAYGGCTSVFKRAIVYYSRREAEKVLKDFKARGSSDISQDCRNLRIRKIKFI